MGPDLSHEQLRELLGAYALGAVAADERQAVERHVPMCPRCRTEVAEHLETAALLAGSGAPAPEGVWQRIAASVGEPASGELRAARRRVLSPLRWAGAAAAATLVAATALLGFKVLDQDRRLDALAAASRVGLEEEAALALVAEDSRPLRLRSSEGNAAVTAVLLPDGTGFLVRDNLRALPPERTYQLWALVDGRAISAGVLGTDPGVTAFKVPPEIEGLAITVERAGGVPVTQNTPLVLGETTA